MIKEHESLTAGDGFASGGMTFGPPSNDDFPEISFEEAVTRFRYWKYMTAEELRSLTFHQHAWRREYLRRIAELERRLRTTF
jgi:hypothetical protein